MNQNPTMPNVASGTVLRSIPLLLLLAAHVWLAQSCVVTPFSAFLCMSPPLSTLALLALAFVELTRGSRIRGAIALIAVAIPFLLIVVTEVIN